MHNHTKRNNRQEGAQSISRARASALPSTAAARLVASASIALHTLNAFTLRFSLQQQPVRPGIFWRPVQRALVLAITGGATTCRRWRSSRRSQTAVSRGSRHNHVCGAVVGCRRVGQKVRKIQEEPKAGTASRTASPHAPPSTPTPPPRRQELTQSASGSPSPPPAPPAAQSGQCHGSTSSPTWQSAGLYRGAEGQG